MFPTSTVSHPQKQQLGLAVLSPDGEWQALSGRTDHIVEIYSIATGSPQRWSVYFGHQDGLYKRQGTIQTIVWSPDSELLVSASSNGSVQVWTRRGIHLRTLRRAGDPPVKALSWKEDGLKLLDEDEEDEQMAHNR
ncbi:MAG: WD40 repeat domain-containing protein [Ktedonobacteraceae bacterium]